MVSSSNRSLERMRKDGRLPPSQYPFGNRIPANTEEELDAHDAAVIRASRPKQAKDAVTNPTTPKNENGDAAAGKAA